MFVVTGLLPLLAVGIAAYIIAKGNITDEVVSESELYLELTKERLADYFSEKRSEGISIAKSKDVYGNLHILMNEEAGSLEYRQSYNSLDQFLQLIHEQYEYDQVFLTDDQGIVKYSTTNQSDFEGSNLEFRDYFIDAINGKQVWSSLFETTQDFNAVVLSTPVYEDGFSNRAIGTLVFLVQEQRITDVVHAGTDFLGATGDAYLVNGEGVFFSNTQRGDYQQGAALNEILETEAANYLQQPISNGDLSFLHAAQYNNYLGNEVLGSLGVFQMGDEPMGIVIEVETSEVFAGLYTLRNYLLISIVIATIIGFVIAFTFARNMTKPMHETVHVLQRMAQGDFSNEFSKDSLNRNDETGKMSVAISEMQHSVKQIIGTVLTSSNQVASSSQQLLASAGETKQASQEVSNSIQEVAEGAELQVKNTQETSQVMEEMAVAIQKVAETASYITDSSREMSTKAGIGGKSVTGAVTQMERIQEETEETTAIIETLKHDSSEIGKFIHLITDISEQTNLLALNAAIEAARAGEAGKGFAVVADEIRKLADQTRNSATTVYDLVVNIQDNTTKAVTSINEGKDEVNKGIVVIGEVGKMFEEIFASVNNVAGQIEDLSAVAEEMSASSEEVTASVAEMAGTSKNASSSAEEVAASSQQQLAAIEEVAHASNELRKMADELQEACDRFKI